MRANLLRVAGYKSFGVTRNELSITSGITVIIGKNESGKTNLTEAAAELDFFRRPYDIERADKKLNRFFGGGEIVIMLSLKDKEKSDEYTQITVRKRKEKSENNSEYEIFISGALENRVRSDKQISNILGQLARLGDEYKRQTHGFYERFCENPYLLLENLEDFLACNLPQNALVRQLLELTKEYVFELPYIVFVGYDSKHLFKEYYYLDELCERNKIKNLCVENAQNYEKSEQNYEKNKQKAEICEDDDVFLKLIDVAGISVSQLIEAQTKSIARQIIQSEFDKIADRFSKVAKKNFSLSYVIRENQLHLTTSINGKKASFDELPISEKWFFALFVDTIWRKIGNKSILFFLDQPGLFMHVNAQRELLDIFRLIAAEGHQIVYTTHSPYLLDINDIASIRAVEKQRGITHIYNKIYAGELATGAKIETLTPILEALGTGASPDHSFKENRLNLIVEGISDYYYIKAMMRYLLKDKKPKSNKNPSKTTEQNNTQVARIDVQTSEFEPYVLPSVGASNIANVASILIGWGQPFKAIVDFDEEGRKAAEKMQHKLGLVMGEDIFYINGERTYTAGVAIRVEDMIDRSDRQKIQTELGKKTKALISREFYDQIKLKKLTPSKATIENFKKLFTALKLM